MTPVSEALVSEERLRTAIEGAGSAADFLFGASTLHPGEWEKRMLDAAETLRFLSQHISTGSAPALSQDEGAGGGEPTPKQAAANLREYAAKRVRAGKAMPGDNIFEDAAAVIDRLALSMRKPSEAEVETAARAISFDVADKAYDLLPEFEQRRVLTTARAALQAAQEVGK